MSLPTVLEKLHFKQEKNILIQGMPSSVEKPFAKLNYAKNVTPLLKSRKIDFALIFAVNLRQLAQIIDEVIPALNTNATFWVAYPKSTSKIYCDLSRDYNWEMLTNLGFELIDQTELDTVWASVRFTRSSEWDGQVAYAVEESEVNA
jgi:hypothetical protein